MVRIINSIFSESAAKWIVFRLCFRFNVPRLNTLLPRNTGWPLCADYSIIWLACWSQFPSGLQLHVAYHFSSFPGQTLWRSNLLFWHSRYIMQNSILFPTNVVEHRHEYDSSLKLIWIYLSSFQAFLNMSENLNRCEPWENIPLEFNWFSINSRQFCIFVLLLEIMNLFFPLDVCFWRLI